MLRCSTNASGIHCIVVTEQDEIYSKLENDAESLHAVTIEKAVTEILPHEQSLPDTQASENSLVIAGLLDHHAQVLPVRW